MDEPTTDTVRQAVEDVCRAESRRVLATLIRLVGDFDLAEEALHEAFAAAVEQWARDGVPASPRAWLVSAGRFKAVDAMRRRASPEGDLILLEDQDRSLWDRAKIAEGRALVEQALASGRAGVYTVQAAIAAVHAEAPTAADTDWARMVAWYDLLGRTAPSPVVALNRAVAVAMRDGPRAGLELIDAILAEGQLADYHLAHAARADLCRRLGRTDEAREPYRKALALARQGPERRFLERRLRELG